MIDAAHLHRASNRHPAPAHPSARGAVCFPSCHSVHCSCETQGEAAELKDVLRATHRLTNMFTQSMELARG
eukprot:3394623-Pleurochrysis_carterae.AAC.1